MVEIDPPCGDGDVLIALGESCITLTTGAAEDVLLQSNNVPTAQLGPVINQGTPLACSILAGGSSSGMKLRGAVNFFGSSIGDVLIGLLFDCK